MPVVHSARSIAAVAVRSHRARRPPTAVRRARCVLDLCCGSGVQGLVAAATYADHVIAADVSGRAVRFTAFNARLNGLSRRLQPVQSDLYAHPLIGASAPFDAILANPPFVAVPLRPIAEYAAWALYADGGPDGAAVSRRVVSGADACMLRPGVSAAPPPRTARRRDAAARERSTCTCPAQRAARARQREGHVLHNTRAPQTCGSSRSVRACAARAAGLAVHDGRAAQRGRGARVAPRREPRGGCVLQPATRAPPPLPPPPP
eukprot:1135883-Prymnesium_polylepis.1